VDLGRRADHGPGRPDLLERSAPKGRCADPAAQSAGRGRAGTGQNRWLSARACAGSCSS
jgi:hypothetical protein